MITYRYVISDKLGLHARNAITFSRAASEYESQVRLSVEGGKSADGKNIMSLTLQEARNKLYIFAGLMGISLSTIFIIYTGQSIIETFLTTAITFGCMSLYGYTTKRDLTSLGSFLFMGIAGLCIASIVNLFVRSSSFSFALSCIGVIIFTLYTAYNVQKLKDLYNYIGTSGGDVAQKIAIFGALDLYITFINLFTTLLTFLGDRRE